MAESPKHDRRAFWSAMLAGLIAELLGDAIKGGLPAAADQLLHPGLKALAAPFDCWAPFQHGKMRAGLYVTARPVIEKDQVIFVIEKVHAYVRGPIPCNAMLARHQVAIADALHAEALDIGLDWSNCDWGEHRHLRRYV